MPSRKQRRRREKAFRHDMALVMPDEEGNEVEVTASELRAQKGKPAKAKAAPAAAKRGKGAPRTLREPPQPSWRRSFRRGGLWGAIMLVVVLFFFQGTLLVRLASGLLYALAFIPLTYWIDRLAYRNYLRRSGKS